jgi:hypothetical protein
MDWTNLQQVLVWIAGIGAPIIVAYLLSWVVENWSAWSTFPREVKFIAPMVVSVGLSLLSAQLLNFPEVITQIQPWFQILMSAILTYLSSQKAYMSAMKAGYGKRFITPTSKMPLERR